MTTTGRTGTATANLALMAGLASTALMLTAIFASVPAAKLDEQTCTQLKQEVTQLEGLGVRDNLAKGAAWGKANLRGAQLEQVKTLIEMDEAIAFRCPRPKPAPPVADPDAAQVKGKAGKALAKVKPAEPARPKPKTKPAAKPTEGQGEAVPAQAKQVLPKPKPQPQQAKPAEPAATAASPPAGGTAAGGASR